MDLISDNTYCSTVPPQSRLEAWLRQTIEIAFYKGCMKHRDTISFIRSIENPFYVSYAFQSIGFFKRALEEGYEQIVISPHMNPLFIEEIQYQKLICLLETNPQAAFDLASNLIQDYPNNKKIKDIFSELEGFFSPNPTSEITNIFEEIENPAEIPIFQERQCLTARLGIYNGGFHNVRTAVELRESEENSLTLEALDLAIPNAMR